VRVPLALIVVLALLVSGCGEEPPRPAAAPLVAQPQALQSLYKWGAGPWSVAQPQTLALPRSNGGESLQVRVFYPTTQPNRAAPASALPVVVFSHGNFSDTSSYDALLRHWASHGYVVIAPSHADAGGGFVRATVAMVVDGNLGVIQERRADLVTVLDELAAVEAAVPVLRGRLDRTRIAAAGHSFGAFNAQQLGGAQAFDTDSESYLPGLDARVKAVVAISPPGPMFDEIDAGSWSQQRLPTLMTTGTWDSNAFFWPQWQLHKTSYEQAQPGNQFALVVRGADHYLGNLICRLELEAEPQSDALNMVNTLAVAFLDAYLNGNQDAMDFLRSTRLGQVTGDFAVLESR
jgi:dienelactone hydrolase